MKVRQFIESFLKIQIIQQQFQAPNQQPYQLIESYKPPKQIQSLITKIILLLLKIKTNRLMSKENIQIQNSYLSSIPKNINEQTNQQIAEEINHLKNIVLELQRKHIAKTAKNINKQDNKQIQNIVQCQQLSTKHHMSDGESKLTFGQQFYKQLNQKFKSRVVSRKMPQRKQYNVNKQQDKLGEQQKSIIYDFQNIKKAQSSNLGSDKIDSQEQQPAKTQFFAPVPRIYQSQPQQFHFKKIDLLPAIEDENHKFKSYLKTYRQKMSSTHRYHLQKGTSSTSSSINNSFKVTSQPQFSQRANSFQKDVKKQQLPQVALNKESSKEELIFTAKRLFQYFIPGFQQETNFTIKKYKNCIVFSLLPEVTKAIIWYYNRQVFFGNVSLSQKGKIQRMGPGVEHVPGRHVYQGHFINGKKNGNGKIIYSNGDEYDGQWNQGQIYGFGIFNDKKTSKRYEGFWKNGQYCGSLSKVSKINLNN